MKTISSVLIPLVLLSTFVLCQASWAEKAYTTDTQEVVVKNTPNSQSKTLAVLPKGSQVEYVKPNEWSMIRYKAPTGELKEGWVQLKFLGSRPPDSTASKETEIENSALREQLASVDKERAGLAQREKEQSDKLSKIEASYEELKGASTNYLKLKSESEAAKSSLAAAQENIQTLIQENEGLKFSQRIQWFAAGALVLLVGWLLGWSTGRRQKRKSRIYY